MKRGCSVLFLLAAAGGLGAQIMTSGEVRFITLDPAHFHAALVQKEMYPGVSRRVAVYAPLGTDLTEHLVRVARFNARPDSPTSWELDIHCSPDFVERMLADRPGNVVVLSGRNRAKIDRIQRSVDAGLNVLADKPWILNSEDLPRIARTLDAAASRNLVAYDIMTERFEVTSILHRELVSDRAVFGDPIPGTESEPGVFMESVHHLMKLVAGVPNLRPVWFFDVEQQGEALSDVGTHLVDLAQWSLFPDQKLDYRTDIRVLSGKHWPTALTKEQWKRVTGQDGGPLDYYCNNSVSYTLRGIHIQMNVLWDFEGASAADIYIARFRGSKARVEVRQGKPENYRPEIYVTPNSAALKAEAGAALRKRLAALDARLPGIGVEDLGSEFRLSIPDRHRVGHEAHFAQVTRQFFEYLKNPRSLPDWEKGYMLAKYYVTTRGVELARGK